LSKRVTLKGRPDNENVGVVGGEGKTDVKGLQGLGRLQVAVKGWGRVSGKSKGKTGKGRCRERGVTAPRKGREPVGVEGEAEWCLRKKREGEGDKAFDCSCTWDPGKTQKKTKKGSKRLLGTYVVCEDSKRTTKIRTERRETAIGVGGNRTM